MSRRRASKREVPILIFFTLRVFSYGCSLLGQDGGNSTCTTIAADGATGTYGTLSFCGADVKLSCKSRLPEFSPVPTHFYFWYLFSDVYSAHFIFSGYNSQACE